MTPNATASPPAIPADVAAFAAEHGVAEYVLPVLEMTQDIFRKAPIELLVEEDAEEWDIRYILYRVNVEGLTVDELVEGQQRWSAELVKRLPSLLLRYFCLGTM